LKGQGRSKTTAVVLAVLFGFFAWLYTYEKDGTKFWINLGLTVVTLGFWGLVAWIWAIIDTASKPEAYYTDYDKSIASSGPSDRPSA